VILLLLLSLENIRKDKDVVGECRIPVDTITGCPLTHAGRGESELLLSLAHKGTMSLTGLRQFECLNPMHSSRVGIAHPTCRDSA